MRSLCALLNWSMVLVIGSSFAASEATQAAGGVLSIYSPIDASPLEQLAAREVRRYVYLRTGTRLPIMTTGTLPGEASGFIVSAKDHPLIAPLVDDALQGTLQGLQSQHYLLKTVASRKGRVLLLTGGDPVGTLYAAYRYAEHLGVRFYLHDDVIPDGRIRLEIPTLDEVAAPLFGLRGIQPFHDFPEGPDWWNADDYKAVVAQLPKLRMNFIGLHTYPEGAPNAEPTVWIGSPEDIGEDGRVAFSYPSSYQNTLRGNWGYAAKPTSEFPCGSSVLFDRDAYGAQVMRDRCPQPTSPRDCNDVFARTGALLRDAFTFARRLGIKTCIGTETPLTVPKAVQERLKAAGQDPADPAIVQKLYEGIFTRIARVHPLDYYWFWTPEGWTWQGAKPEEVTATYANVRTAIAAARKVNASFRLATCGWVLGPQDDRSAFDREFPKDMAISCISRQVGMAPVEPGFAQITGREKWAIPWLEDDPGLTAPQLWVGRMRRDAADAKRYGCTGLMGIHWRTRTLAPNVLALAQAAWDQSAWIAPQQAAFGPLGGQVAAYPNSPIEGTDDDPLYQTVRYDVRGYRIPAPDGKYKVTLKFCEPHYNQAGVRTFDVSVGGRSVLTRMDIFARVGKNKALDFTFKDVEAAHGRLEIGFGHRIEFPCIAAIVVEGSGFTKKINCGGPAYKDYEADSPPVPDHLPSGDFYRDWARAEFGPAVADELAALFEKLDGKLPRPADWVDGPGGVRVDPRPWSQVVKEYAFVDELEAFRPRITGPGSLERFDYWLNTFRYMRAIGHARCVWGELEAVMVRIRAEQDAAARQQLATEQALPIRKRLVGIVSEVYRHLLAHVSNPGEMGTVANWAQHVHTMLLDKPGEELVKALGEALPADAQLSRTYDSTPRLIVPTLRTSLMAGEQLTLTAIVLDGQPARTVNVYWRPMATGAYHTFPMTHLARGTYTATLPAEATAEDLEYYLEATTAGGQTLVFPAGAPEVNRTVVVMPSGR